VGDLGFDLGLGQELRPVGHHQAALFEQVTTAVGGFDLVANGMGQRHFCGVAGVVGTLAGPVAEGGPEAMGDTASAKSLKNTGRFGRLLCLHPSVPTAADAVGKRPRVNVGADYNHSHMRRSQAGAWFDLGWYNWRRELFIDGLGSRCKAPRILFFYTERDFGRRRRAAEELIKPAAA
jgi:hypothetical protein